MKERRDDSTTIPADGPEDRSSRSVLQGGIWWGKLGPRGRFARILHTGVGMIRSLRVGGGPAVALPLARRRNDPQQNSPATPIGGHDISACPHWKSTNKSFELHSLFYFAVYMLYIAPSFPVVCWLPLYCPILGASALGYLWGSAGETRS
ncbi:predicted protein [Coccidioides posadasii str. Silveira]|uniref:Predicted protein n=2 Tax=Coccidioides posadasii TaxID=199306 RepID=E9CWN8_COCPS|nr:predicted protein [Coccidioides posadasii str. Silveira]KMM65184.1 hypothetical protein CPAG_01536 [Coccidioides posadasii RMSCC 3488]